MTMNLGSLDRIIRVVLGVILLALPFVTGISGVASTVAVIAGIVLIATSAIKFCPAYRIFGIRTCKM